ncbi:MAG: chitobiase/beta-hexosaminidase C-terminal domain-containing protein, partial [Verrucomicrobiota bacterium]
TATSQPAVLTVNLPAAAGPVFTPNGGTFSTPPTVTLSSATPGAAIRYTTNGSTPSPTTGTLYTGPFTLAASATVRALAYATGYANSAVTSASFTLATPVSAEFELLTVAASSGSAVRVTNDAQASGGKTVLYRSTANGQFITFALGVPTPGTYSLQISAKRMSDRGILQLAVANSLGGPYTNIDTPKDEYTAAITFGNIPAFTSPVTFSTPGTQYLRFTVTGKNAASSDRNLNFDRILLTPQ